MGFVPRNPEFDSGITESWKEVTATAKIEYKRNRCGDNHGLCGDYNINHWSKMRYIDILLRNTDKFFILYALFHFSHLVEFKAWDDKNESQ